MAIPYSAEDLEAAAKTLLSGGIILYPTDTIWGIGCMANNEKAVERIFAIKQRPESKTMILLCSSEDQLWQYVSAENFTAAWKNEISNPKKPLTIIYRGGKNLPPALIAADGSIAIRIVEDEFCKALIDKTGVPLVSTSANRSGEPSPAKFGDIEEHIKEQVDHIVEHRRTESEGTVASRIIKFNDEGRIVVIRE